ncbi:MAG: hypothetical protein QOJ40_332 [Verrucomicrobiota bacterium]
MTLPPPTERQARLIWLAVTGLAMAVLAALVVALVWGLGRVVEILAPVLWPLAAAGILSYLLDPVVDFLHRRGASRPRAILCVFSLALLILTALCASIVPQLVNEARDLASRVPDYAHRLENRVEQWVSHPPPLLRKLLEKASLSRTAPPVNTSTNQSTTASMTNFNANAGLASTNQPPAAPTAAETKEWQTAATWLASILPQVGTWLLGQVVRVASWFGVLAGLALIPVYTFYFLLEKQRISSRWTDYLPMRDSGFKVELVFVLNSINNYLIAFFRGQVLVAICDGVLYGLGFVLIGLPYALLIGAAAVVLTIIPFLGAFIICIASLIIALVQFSDWLHPLLVLAVFGVVQTLEGIVISPKIMGGRVGLHPLTLIIAVMVGTTLLGGLLGGILAIPLTAALRVVMFRYVWKKPSA